MANLKKKLEALAELYESEIDYIRDIHLWKILLKSILEMGKVRLKGSYPIMVTLIKNIENIERISVNIVTSLIIKNNSALGIEKQIKLNEDDYLNLPRFPKELKALLNTDLEYYSTFDYLLNNYEHYIKYIQNLPQVEREFETLLDTDSYFLRIVDDYLIKQNSKNLGIRNYLFRPTGKIVRYSTLIKAVIKNEQNQKRKEKYEELVLNIVEISKKLDFEFKKRSELFQTFDLSTRFVYGSVSNKYSLGLMYKKTKLLKEGKLIVKLGPLIPSSYKQVFIFNRMILFCLTNDKPYGNLIIDNESLFLSKQYILKEYLEYFGDEDLRNLYPLFLVQKSNATVKALYFEDESTRDVYFNIIDQAIQKIRSNLDHNVQIREIKKFDTDLKCICFGENSIGSFLCSSLNIKESSLTSNNIDNESEDENTNLNSTNSQARKNSDGANVEGSSSLNSIGNKVKISNGNFKIDGGLSSNYRSEINKEQDKENRSKKELIRTPNDELSLKNKSFGSWESNEITEESDSKIIRDVTYEFKQNVKSKKENLKSKEERDINNKVISNNSFNKENNSLKSNSSKCFKNKDNTKSSQKLSSNSKVESDSFSSKKNHLEQFPDSSFSDKLESSKDQTERCSEELNKANLISDSGSENFFDFKNFGKEEDDSNFIYHPSNDSFDQVITEETTILDNCAFKNEKSEVSQMETPKGICFNLCRSGAIPLTNATIKNKISKERYDSNQKLRFYSDHTGIYSVYENKVTKLRNASASRIFYDPEFEILIALFGDSVQIGKFNFEMENFEPQVMNIEASNFFFGKSNDTAYIAIVSREEFSVSVIHLLSVFYDNETVSIEVLRKLYVGFSIFNIFFLKGRIIIACRDFEIIEIDTLKTQELLEIYDSTLSLLLESKDYFEARSIIKLEKNSFLLCFNGGGYLVNKSGLYKEDSVNYDWEMSGESFKAYKRHIIVLGEHYVSVFEIETGKMVLCEYMQGMKMVDGCQEPLIYNKRCLYEIIFEDNEKQILDTKLKNFTESVVENEDNQIQSIYDELFNMSISTISGYSGWESTAIEEINGIRRPERKLFEERLEPSIFIEDRSSTEEEFLITSEHLRATNSKTIEESSKIERDNRKFKTIPVNKSKSSSEQPISNESDSDIISAYKKGSQDEDSSYKYNSQNDFKKEDKKEHSIKNHSSSVIKLTSSLNRYNILNSYKINTQYYHSDSRENSDSFIFESSSVNKYISENNESESSNLRVQIEKPKKIKLDSIKKSKVKRMKFISRKKKDLWKKRKAEKLDNELSQDMDVIGFYEE